MIMHNVIPGRYGSGDGNTNRQNNQHQDALEKAKRAEKHDQQKYCLERDFQNKKIISEKWQNLWDIFPSYRWIMRNVQGFFWGKVSLVHLSLYQI